MTADAVAVRSRRTVTCCESTGRARPRRAYFPSSCALAVRSAVEADVNAAFAAVASPVLAAASPTRASSRPRSADALALMSATTPAAPATNASPNNAHAVRRAKRCAGERSVTQADAHAKNSAAAASADGASAVIARGIRSAATDAPIPTMDPIQATRSGNR